MLLPFPFLPATTLFDQPPHIIQRDALDPPPGLALVTSYSNPRPSQATLHGTIYLFSSEFFRSVVSQFDAPPSAFSIRPLAEYNFFLI
jgi:hypothetical protein